MSLRFGSAEEAGLSRDELITAYELLLSGLDEDAYAGAVCLVARHGVIAGFWALGWRRLQEPAAAMTHDAIFDLASLTKAIVTAPVILRLRSEGKLSLEDPLCRHLPWTEGSFAGEAKLIDLLTHRGGLPPTADIGWAKEPRQRHSELLAAIGTEPRTGGVYSDLGYYLLGCVAEAAGGEPLPRLFGRVVQGPLGLFGSGYGPRDAGRQPIVASEERPEGLLEGVVHDGKARLMGGIAGHAGLFAPALDVALFGQAVLDGGMGRFGTMLPKAEAALLLAPHTAPPDPRGLGFFEWGERDGNDFFFPAWGHTGYTGTSFAIAPKTGLLVVLLTNRVHPVRRPEERLKSVRSRFHRAVWHSQI
ncbi:MAG: serine hydrolase [Thermaerobacter sp.]|nr:serine hydrolase [Thermaerobacter sp.]